MPYTSKLFKRKADKARTRLFVTFLTLAILTGGFSLVEKIGLYSVVKESIDRKFYPEVMVEEKIRYLIKRDNLNPGNTNLKKLSKVIVKKSHKYQISVNTIISIVRYESEFNKDAKGPALKDGERCKGLMQIYLKYWGHMIPNKDWDLIFDEDINVEIGCFVLSSYKEITKGDLKMALVLYNGGSRSIVRDGDKIRYLINGDSELYVSRIFSTTDDLNLKFKD